MNKECLKNNHDIQQHRDSANLQHREKIDPGDTFEQLLCTVGDFGRYQLYLYICLSLPLIVNAFHRFAWVFTGTVGDHRCIMPGEHALNASFHLSAEEMNKSFPWNDRTNSWSQCERFDISSLPPENPASNESSRSVVLCDQWVYDDSKYVSSAVYEFNLVCDKEWMRIFVDTFMMFGSMIGCLFIGTLADSLGRRPVYVTLLVLQPIVGIANSWAPNYATLLITRCMLGATVSGIFIVGYVTGMEMVGRSRRQFVCGVLNLFFSVGYIACPAIASLIKDWRILQLVFALSGILFLTYICFIDESPRWLLGQGKVGQASRILQRAARINGAKISTEALDKRVAVVGERILSESTTDASKSSIWQIIAHPNLRRNALLMTFLCFTNAVLYYGLAWSTKELGGNELVNFAVMGVAEIPGYLLVMGSLNRTGRKPMQIASLGIITVSMLSTCAVPQGNHMATLALAILGKGATTAALATTNIIIVEIFPTCVRNAGMGVGSFFGIVGAMLSPFIIPTASVWKKTPFVIFGCVAFLASLSAFLLPETLNADLPDYLVHHTTITEHQTIKKSNC